MGEAVRAWTRAQPVIAVDWTEWHHELRMLVASVVTGKRASSKQMGLRRGEPIRFLNGGWSRIQRALPIMPTQRSMLGSSLKEP